MLLGLSSSALAYERPAGGRWIFENLFDDTRSGAFTLSQDGGTVVKLVLTPGEDSVDQCGSQSIRLVTRAKIRSYATVNGRYAFGRIRAGLFVPTGVTFKRGVRAVGGRLLLLFDQTGKRVDSGKAELPGDCHISFYARKQTVRAAVAAAAQEGKVKDERSSGTGYDDPRIEARCDISSLEATIQGSTLQAIVTSRGEVGETGSAQLRINTTGGGSSAPEFVVGDDGSVSTPNGSATSRGAGTVTVVGRQMTFRVPLGLLGRAAKKLGVQAKTCGEGAVDVAPGPDYFGRDAEPVYRYLTAVPAERVIDGRVMLICASSGRMCRRLPVKGATVKAVGGSPKRTFTGETDEKGRFELGVEKGLYTVTADAGPLQLETRSKRVDVQRRRTGSAAFEGCGIGSSLAGTAAVNGGTWRGGNRDCLNYFEISWRPSSQALSISWKSMPVCTGAGGNWVGPAKLLLRSQLLDPGQAGHNLVVKPAEVGFLYPIYAPQNGNNVSGTLTAAGGKVNARYVEGLCTYGISNLSLNP
ncbi:carboxypeptidase-like regulatory domain-containing protein [Conexibacter sp. CPCC 206217]|uniref:carboxypeptidase-like regulatory domain-containing protein n=1 Tax=Conexibacter sp. CPCC 206217 TaxID=3064574 RepID=UPI00271E13E2|nr:carboxypeptidase-like regulatory domain-containing protein [Conexibacter sp. CPCC 206217]MDO8208796.1 carboxypeptidase-like regulatory domain-containing protein [Conexibacter sp. CPCC 206217]